MSSKQAGLVFLNKPSGVTSFQALHTLKKRLGHGKVGHTGTLDKFAEGLLIALAGKNTRLAPYFEGLDKTYTAAIRFGATTETLDTESPEIDPKPVPELDSIKAQISGFIGQQDQIPPQYSAVHVDGTRAYQRSLKGETVDIPARRIYIYSIEFIEWQAPVLRIRIQCSKGTYIRALARDLGRACGSAAYLQALQRTHIGPFDLGSAVEPEDFDPQEHLVSASAVVQQLPSIKTVPVRETAVGPILNGNPVQTEWLAGDIGSEGLYALLDTRNELCALVELKDGMWKYRYVAERH
ncbi:MAG: tRNA pseudouridine(55) synthase TruB [Spirochaetota bacterium]